VERANRVSGSKLGSSAEDCWDRGRGWVSGGRVRGMFLCGRDEGTTRELVAGARARDVFLRAGERGLVYI
jgi:hypothetical protein